MLVDKIFRRVTTDAYLSMYPERFPVLRRVTRRTFSMLALAAFSLPRALRGDTCLGQEDCFGFGPCDFSCCEGAHCTSSCMPYGGACPSGNNCWTSVDYHTCCDCKDLSTGELCFCDQYGDIPVRQGS